MGEFAIINGERTKIGTCNNMFYLTYEDRKKVTPVSDSVNPATTKNLRFRLPYPDEDKYGISKIEGDAFRVCPLPEYSDPELAETPGTTQLTNNEGLLVNVKCYHGEKLPEGNDDVQFFWNGKAHFYVLAFVKNTPDGVKPIIKCKGCGEMWCVEWKDVLPYIYDKELKKRLEVY